MYKGPSAERRHCSVRYIATGRQLRNVTSHLPLAWTWLDLHVGFGYCTLTLRPGCNWRRSAVSVLYHGWVVGGKFSDCQCGMEQPLRSNCICSSNSALPSLDSGLLACRETNQGGYQLELTHVCLMHCLTLYQSCMCSAWYVATWIGCLHTHSCSLCRPHSHVATAIQLCLNEGDSDWVAT